MWFNHLNPVVNHSKWTLPEDIQLFKLAGEFGTKWAKISKSLNGLRTEHMVKNRFNSIHKKFLNRYQRCSLKKIIEFIRNHLEQKLETGKEVEESCTSRNNEVNSQSEEVIPKKYQEESDEQAEDDGEEISR